MHKAINLDKVINVKLCEFEIIAQIAKALGVSIEDLIKITEVLGE